MGLVGINSVSNPTIPKKDLQDQIAQGVGIAANILGIGLKSYEDFGKPAQIHQAYEQAQTNKDNAMAAYMATKPATEQAKIEAGIKVHNDTVTGHQTKQQASDFKSAKTDIESMRGNSGLQLARKNLLLAENVLSAAKPYINDLANAPSNAVTAIDLETGKLQSGGVPSREEMQSITDHTIQSELAKLTSKVLNAPQGAGQGAFLPNKLRYANEIKENSLNVIQRAYDRKLKDWKSRLSDSDYSTLKANIDEELGAYRATAIPMTSDAQGNAVVVTNPSATGPHGASITQGGHVFHWNPQTKDYE